MTNNYDRYSRQLLFSKIGLDGQDKLSRSRVAIVGMGALGTVIANHLTRSGVGFVRIIDRDFVEISNLQRQMLFDENDVATSQPKAIAAYNKLIKINASIMIEPLVMDLHPWNAEDYLTDVDVILDGTDNFLTRYLINDISIKHKIPWIHGAAVRSRGMFAAFRPHQGPCYRCLFPNPPDGVSETCDLVGVISPVTHMVGSFQAVEAIKLLVQDDSSVNNCLVHFDSWWNDEMKMDLTASKNPNCPACANHQFDFLATATFGEEYSTLCGRNAVQISPKQDRNVNFQEMKEKLIKLGKVTENPFLLKFELDSTITLVLFKNGRVVVQGTDDLTKAKVFYHQYISS